jgi:hypothetical protein
MLFGIAVRALLWTLLGVLLVGVFFYLAIDLGLVDLVFHSDTKPKLDRWKAFMSEKYGLNKDTIDNAVKIVGLAVTFIYGALQFLRAWHFAKINLPLRFQQYADRIKEAHVIGRTPLFAPYWCYNLRGDRVPTTERVLFDTLFSYFAITPHQKAIQQLMSSVSQLGSWTPVSHSGSRHILSLRINWRQKQDRCHRVVLRRMLNTRML